MPAGAAVILGGTGTQKFDSAATANTLELRDNNGGVTNNAVTTGALTLNGPENVQMVTVTTTYSVLLTDNVVVVDGTSGAFNATLPSPAGVGAGRVIQFIKKDAAHNVTVVPNASETINGTSSKVLSTQYAITKFITDGTNWYAQ